MVNALEAGPEGPHLPHRPPWKLRQSEAFFLKVYKCVSRTWVIFSRRSSAVQHLPSSNGPLLVCGNVYLADNMPWFHIWIGCPTQAGKLLLCTVKIQSQGFSLLGTFLPHSQGWKISANLRPKPQPASPPVCYTLLLFQPPCWSRVLPQHFKRCHPEEIPIFPTTHHLFCSTEPQAACPHSRPLLFSHSVFLHRLLCGLHCNSTRGKRFPLLSCREIPTRSKGCCHKLP